VLERGKGCWVWDTNGKKYLDMVAGIAVNVLGHCHPVVTEALARQSKTLIHTSNLYYTTPQIELARLLIENSCFSKVFFCNSGAEANEGAFKLARKWGKANRNGAYEIISTRSSFHGRTLATLAATGQQKYQAPFTPMPDGFTQVPYNDMVSLRDATSDKTVAVLVEPVQGESGVHPARKRYLELLREWCDAKNLLLVFDEIQTGVGRTGRLFGYQLYGVEPDILTMAKGTAGGVPIGAFLAKQRADVFVHGDHGSTFGGNPLATATGAAVLRFVIENKLWENAERVGAHLKARLEDLKARKGKIAEVRGVGLMVGLDFSEEVAKDFVLKAQEKGLIVNATGPKTLRMVPPLILTEKEADTAVDIMESVL
jgi:acetylornithine aminotransferase/acetylornithine/N-succinyldiaminopimelate aminotransferase